TPKASRKTTSSPWTTAIDRPGTIFLSTMSFASARSLGSATATASLLGGCRVVWARTATGRSSVVAAPARTRRRVDRSARMSLPSLLLVGARRQGFRRVIRADVQLNRQRGEDKYLCGPLIIDRSPDHCRD